MKHLLAFLVFTASALAITTGDVEVRTYNGAGFTSTYLSWSNGQIILKSGGVPTATTLNSAAVGLGNVENTALSTWAGSTNLTTLGTITAGTWHGTIIAPAYLGTGSSITTKFLRGDGTWQTVESGLTIDTTTISGGTVGRVLYHKTGNVVGELETSAGGNGSDDNGKLATYNASGNLTASQFNVQDGITSASYGPAALTFDDGAGNSTTVFITLAGSNTVTLAANTGTILTTGALGTGVATALGVNVGTAGAFVVNGGALGTPSSGTLTNCTFPTLNQNTTGSAASLSISGQTGLLTFTGITSTNREKTVRDAADTLLELGGSYTPTGTWTNMNLVTPALGTPSAIVLTNATGSPTGISLTKSQLNTVVSDDDPAYVGAPNAFTAAQTISAAGAASAPPLYLTGSLYTGGNGTTTFPHFFHQPTGATAATTWSSGSNNGTVYGANEASGFTGNFSDFRTAGLQKFVVDKTGCISTAVQGGDASTFDSLGGGSLLVYTNNTANGVRIYSSISLNWAGDLLLFRDGAATLQMGQDVNADAVDQAIKAADGTTGTDRSGGDMNIKGGLGTGAGAVSSVIFSTPTALASGTTAQSYTERMRINSSGVKIGANGTAISQSTVTTTALDTSTIAAMTVREDTFTVTEATTTTPLSYTFSDAQNDDLRIILIRSDSGHIYVKWYNSNAVTARAPAGNITFRTWVP